MLLGVLGSGYAARRVSAWLCSRCEVSSGCRCRPEWWYPCLSFRVLAQHQLHMTVAHDDAGQWTLFWPSIAESVWPGVGADQFRACGAIYVMHRARYPWIPEWQVTASTV